jgi:hypothetical protein
MATWKLLAQESGSDELSPSLLRFPTSERRPWLVSTRAPAVIATIDRPVRHVSRRGLADHGSEGHRTVGRHHGLFVEISDPSRHAHLRARDGDIGLPGMNGTGVARTLVRTDAPPTAIPECNDARDTRFFVGRR